MSQTSAPNLAPLALTMGEPAGIAPEITVKAWQTLRSSTELSFGLIADPALFDADLVQVIDSIDQAPQVFAHKLPVLPISLAEENRVGHLNPNNGPAVLQSVQRGVELTMAGQARGLVTNPFHKGALYQSGFNHPGHTEYLAELAGTSEPTVMMLAASMLRVVPITLHVSVADAIKQLSPRLIRHACLLTRDYLRANYGIAEPRLAVSGLNPHAGEGGAMGREEIDIIAPTLDRLRAEGLIIQGPLSADTMFHGPARATYDAALCMTHDQALIPIKTLVFDEGVNLTMGLPFVRSSPDHGTALDIAGKDCARPDSLIAAITMAHELTL